MRSTLLDKRCHMSNKNKNYVVAEPVIKFEMGSNRVTIDGKEKYLDIIVWDNKITYEDIKEHIV